MKWSRKRKRDASEKMRRKRSTYEENLRRFCDQEEILKEATFLPPPPPPPRHRSGELLHVNGPPSTSKRSGTTKLITVVLFHTGNKAIFSLLSLLLQPTAIHTCHTFFEPCQSDPFLLAGDNVCVVTSSIIYVGLQYILCRKKLFNHVLVPSSPCG